MGIISELSSSQIKSNRRDTLATGLSIFLAVVLLGTVIFIIGSIRTDNHKEIVSSFGDYQVSIADLNKDMIEFFFDNNDIERISFDKYIKTDMNAMVIEKGAYYSDLKKVELISGRQASFAGELIAPTRFLNAYKEYEVGSKLIASDRVYTIVGEYNDYGKSFEENELIGVLADESKKSILEDSDGIVAYVWYKNPRDTYILTKKIFDEFKMDYSKALDIGSLYFNKDVLEYKMIYPSGIIPPKHVINNVIESYGPCMILVILFAVIIYGAFNVWNNRDMKEIALLKSVGMTEKQVKKMIRLKAIKIGIVPILMGIVTSYLISNLLLYLMWLNNLITYKHISNIFGEKIREVKFHLIDISFPLILIILVLAVLTVHLSAIIPAEKSAKLNVIEGLVGVTKGKVGFGKSKIVGNVEATLAKDYFKAYNSTYRTIILSLLLSAVVMTTVSVSQSYRTVNSIYGKYNSPYNFTSKIYTLSTLNRQLIDDLKKVEGIDEFHIYMNKHFKFYFEDNKGFESSELKTVFEIGAKEKDDSYINIIGLLPEDFENVMSSNKIDISSNCILLNKTPDSDSSPYFFRNYVKVTDGNKKDIVLRYNAEGKQIPIRIDGYIENFPFDLEGQTKNGIYLFTRMDKLESFIRKHGLDEADPANNYTVQIKTKGKSDQVFDECERIISSYIPQNDHSTTTDFMRKAMNEEQLRNEHMLNFGIQFIIIVLALSNAYNSFHGNLRARKREFQLLLTVGMTEKQMKKMVFLESRILFVKVFLLYSMVFSLAVIVRAYKSNFEFGFAVSEILMNLNYLPIIIVLNIMWIGVVLAIRNAIKSILDDDLNSTMKEN